MIKKGYSRCVICLLSYVIKFPRLSSHLSFLEGCRANYQERDFYKSWSKICIKKNNKYAPSLFCSWFGLIQIQVKCKELDRPLTDKERDYFRKVTEDFKQQNFGWYKGKLVCFDYA